MKHMLRPLDFSVEETAGLLSPAGRIEKNRAAYAKVIKGEGLVTLFYGPSTRTRLSFEAAMLNLGGSVLNFRPADAGSASKGENVADTIRVVSCYADVIVMRHPEGGVSMVASEFSRMSIISAGDRGRQRPTQTLTDLMTIQSPKGRLNHMTVGLCGDLKFDRTVHSLISPLIRYPGIRFVLILPPEFRIPDYIREDVLGKDRIPFTGVDNLEASTPDLDILHMTRVQKERFFGEGDYIHLKDSYILTEEKLRNAKKGMFILHPLPRVNEIVVEVDKDPHTTYSKQVQYGVYICVALIIKPLEVKGTCQISAASRRALS